VCVCVVSQRSYGHFLKLSQFYSNNVTQRIVSCYTHKMAIVQ